MIKYSSDMIKHSNDNPININSCGELILKNGTHILRPNGRKDYQLIYIYAGNCVVKKDGCIFYAKKDDVILYKPDETQDYHFTEDNSHTYYIHFNGPFCEKYFEILGINNALVIDVGKNRDIRHLFSLVCKYFNLLTENRTFICSGLIQTILALISNQVKNTSESNTANCNLSKINELITKFKIVPNIRMSISECAKFCNLSETHFRRIFKDITGSSPNEFITKIKINRAKELLLFTEYSISEIAESCGFEDQNYFSRVFKLNAGTNPTEYRKSK